MFNEYSDMATVDEFCEMLRIGKNKGYELLCSGKVGAFRDERLWMIPKEAVIDYVIAEAEFGSESTHINHENLLSHKILLWYN